MLAPHRAGARAEALTAYLTANTLIGELQYLGLGGRTLEHADLRQ